VTTKILTSCCISQALQKVAIIGGATVAGAIIVPVTIAALGFSTGGVVAGESPNI
jgi:hypothetical protein